MSLRAARRAVSMQSNMVAGTTRKRRQMRVTKQRRSQARRRGPGNAIRWRPPPGAALSEKLTAVRADWDQRVAALQSSVARNRMLAPMLLAYARVGDVEAAMDLIQTAQTQWADFRWSRMSYVAYIVVLSRSSSPSAVMQAVRRMETETGHAADGFVWRQVLSCCLERIRRFRPREHAQPDSLMARKEFEDQQAKVEDEVEVAVTMVEAAARAGHPPDANLLLLLFRCLTEARRNDLTRELVARLHKSSSVPTRVTNLCMVHLMQAHASSGDMTSCLTLAWRLHDRGFSDGSTAAFHGSVTGAANVTTLRTTYSSRLHPASDLATMEASFWRWLPFEAATHGLWIQAPVHALESNVPLAPSRDLEPGESYVAFTPVQHQQEDRSRRAYRAAQAVRAWWLHLMESGHCPVNATSWRHVLFVLAGGRRSRECVRVWRHWLRLSNLRSASVRGHSFGSPSTRGSMSRWFRNESLFLNHAYNAWADAAVWAQWVLIWTSSETATSAWESDVVSHSVQFAWLCAWTCAGLGPKGSHGAGDAQCVMPPTCSTPVADWLARWDTWQQEEAKRQRQRGPQWHHGGTENAEDGDTFVEMEPYVPHPEVPPLPLGVPSMTDVLELFRSIHIQPPDNSAEPRSSGRVPKRWTESQRHVAHSLSMAMAWLVKNGYTDAAMGLFAHTVQHAPHLVAWHHITLALDAAECAEADGHSLALGVGKVAISVGLVQRAQASGSDAVARLTNRLKQWQ